MDFKGRANVASVKNCQFVHSDPIVPAQGALPLNAEQAMKVDAEKEFLIQLGKVRVVWDILLLCIEGPKMSC